MSSGRRSSSASQRQHPAAGHQRIQWFGPGHGRGSRCQQHGRRPGRRVQLPLFPGVPQREYRHVLSPSARSPLTATGAKLLLPGLVRAIRRPCSLMNGCINVGLDGKDFGFANVMTWDTPASVGVPIIPKRRFWSTRFCEAAIFIFQAKRAADIMVRGLQVM